MAERLQELLDPAGHPIPDVPCVGRAGWEPVNSAEALMNGQPRCMAAKSSRVRAVAELGEGTTRIVGVGGDDPVDLVVVVAARRSR